MNFQYTGQQQEGTVEQIGNSIGKTCGPYDFGSEIDQILFRNASFLVYL